MIVEFVEQGHLYAVNGEIARLSVTELLAKHGLAPDYEKVDKTALKKKAETGKEIHKDLENVLNTEDYEPKTRQGEQFKEWCDRNLEKGVGEQLLGLESYGMFIGGTADFMGIMKDGTPVIADHKTTSQLHKEYVTWQVSLLDYFARRLNGEKLNGKALNWKGAKKFLCFHYTPELKVVKLDKIPDSEIIKLLDCELHGEIYQRPKLVIDKDLRNKLVQCEEQLYNAELVVKEIKKEVDKARAELLKAFKKQGIDRWESPNGKILATYMPAKEALHVDEKRLMTKYPWIFAECQKLTRKEAYVRITVRKDKEVQNEKEQLTGDSDKSF